MISNGEGYKPLNEYKANRNNLSKSGGLVLVDEEYIEKRFKNVKIIKLGELEEFLKD